MQFIGLSLDLVPTTTLECRYVILTACTKIELFRPSALLGGKNRHWNRDHPNLLDYRHNREKIDPQNA